MKHGLNFIHFYSETFLSIRRNTFEAYWINFHGFINLFSIDFALSFNVLSCGNEPSDFQAIPLSSLAYHQGMGLNAILIFMSSSNGLGHTKQF